MCNTYSNDQVLRLTTLGSGKIPMFETALRLKVVSNVYIDDARMGYQGIEQWMVDWSSGIPQDEEF